MNEKRTQEELRGLNTNRVIVEADYTIRCPRHGKLSVSGDEYRPQDPSPCGCCWRWADDGSRQLIADASWR